MSSKKPKGLTWQEEMKLLPWDLRLLEAAVQALNAEEIIEEVDKIPERYLKPFEKPTNAASAEKPKRGKGRQKWTTPDEIAAALTYRLVEKEHGKYQNIQEDRKRVNQVFAGKQRFVRSMWPQYENVPAYKPPTHEALTQRITKKCKEYEPFFKDPENTHIAECLDRIKVHPGLDADANKKQPLQKPIVEPRSRESEPESEAEDDIYFPNVNNYAGADEETLSKIEKYSKALDADIINMSRLDEAYRFVVKLEKEAKYELARSLCERHVQALKGKAELSRQHAEYLYMLAGLLLELGKYDEAGERVEEAVRVVQARLNNDSVANDKDQDLYARAINIRAAVLQAQGRHAESEKLYRDALSKVEEQHDCYASYRNNLALLLHAQGKYGAAEEIARAANKHIRQELSGRENPYYAITLGTLCLALKDQGKYDEAEALLRLAMRLAAGHHGIDHPKYADRMIDLARVFMDQREFNDAEALMKGALGIYEKFHGKMHPTYAIGLHNLFCLRERQGRLDEAEELIQEVVSVYEKAYGKEHPRYAQGLSNMGELYRKKQNYHGAKRLLDESLRITMQAFDKEHPQIAETLDNLARLSLDQDKQIEAYRLGREALQIAENKLGLDHPKTKKYRERWEHWDDQTTQGLCPELFSDDGFSGDYTEW